MGVVFYNKATFYNRPMADARAMSIQVELLSAECRRLPCILAGHRTLAAWWHGVHSKHSAAASVTTFLSLSLLVVDKLLERLRAKSLCLSAHLLGSNEALESRIHGQSEAADEELGSHGADENVED